TKRFGKGTGLGLSTVMDIVKNHRGQITVQSEAGKGACFRICLPASRPERGASTENPNKELPRGNGEWVLVVDNEETILEITTATLEHFGYRVLTASDGTEALARYASYKDKIDLVITDMVMPFLDGKAMIRALQRMNQAVKVLAISGKLDNRRASDE